MAITKEVLGTIDLTREIVTDASDTFVQQATYDPQTNRITIKFNEGKPDIVIDLSSLKDVYTADDKTIQLSGNEFSVKDGEFVKNLKGQALPLSSSTLGQYLTILTEKLGGKAE